MWIVVSAGGSIGSSGPSEMVSVTRGIVSDGLSKNACSSFLQLSKRIRRKTNAIRNLVM